MVECFLDEKDVEVQIFLGLTLNFTLFVSNLVFKAFNSYIIKAFFSLELYKVNS